MSKYTKKQRKRMKKQRQKALESKENRQDKKAEEPISIRKIFSENLIFIFILVLLCVGIYYKSLDNELTLIDDFQGITQNEKLLNFRDSLKSLHIQKITYSIFVNLFEYNPLPFRIYSVALHTINTILGFIFIYLLFKKRKVAILASLLFAVHTLNSEAVLWISAVPYLNLSFSLLVIFISFLLFRQRENKKYLYLTYLFFVLQIVLLRSPWVLVTPLALIVLDTFMIQEKFKLSNYRWLLFFVIVTAVYFSTIFFGAYDNRVAIRLGGGRKTTQFAQSLTPVIQGYPYTISLLFKQYVFPSKLTVYYDGHDVSDFLLFGMYILMFIYIGITAFFLYKNKKIAGLLILIPVLTAPVFSPVKVTWFYAERYSYLGTLFYSCLLVFLLLFLEKKLHKNKYITFAVMGIILILLSYKTFIRNDDWQNTETISFANMKSAPLSVRSYNDVAGYYYYRGDIKKAVEYYEKGLDVLPTSGTGISNLGLIYFDLGPLVFWEDTEIPAQDPERAQAYLQSAINYLRESDVKTASYLLNKAVLYDQNSVEIWASLGDLYFSVGKHDWAKRLYENALLLDPENELILNQLNLINQ